MCDPLLIMLAKRARVGKMTPGGGIRNFARAPGIEAFGQ
jgi:hypothetical protein